MNERWDIVWGWDLSSMLPTEALNKGIRIYADNCLPTYAHTT